MRCMSSTGIDTGEDTIDSAEVSYSEEFGASLAKGRSSDEKAERSLKAIL